MKQSGKFARYIAKHKLSLCFGLNFLCVFAILAFFWFSKTPEQYDKSMIMAVAVFTLDLGICSAIFILARPAQPKGAKKKEAADLGPLLENIKPDLVYAFDVPVLITEPGGYVLWHNEAALREFSKPGGPELLWKNLSAIFKNQLGPKSDQNESAAFELSINGKYFNAANFVLNQGTPDKGKLCIYVFFDATELEYLKSESENKDPVAAYFMIDNLDETDQKMQDEYRNASAAVSDLLGTFIAGCGGLIKEYSKNKYICFFENRALKGFIKSKFGILNLVRDIKIEELDMPVTISGGVSNITGSLLEKEAAARHALDLALQRGGDQVVVKSLSSTEYYGGKTQTVQKRTKVKSRIIADELSQHMKKSTNILIMGHKNGDSDSIGASVGMARLAMSLKLEADINIVVNIHDPNIKSAFSKLRGLEGYPDIFIDEAAALDKISAETFAVILDVNNPAHFESEAIYKNAYRCAIVDHHRKTSEYSREPDVFYLEPSASSTSELVAEILEQSLSPGALLKEEAELLLAGIFLDTKNFSRNTGPRTFSAALYLRGEGASPSEAVGMVSKMHLDDFTKQARFESNAEIYRDIVAISIFEEEATANDKTAGAKAAERMLEIEG
ncbi:MAG: DHH family phosphoesterase, partial [Oscillospiraceae bacterium]|nr:DHH family phosphoesterase [Oscillospiraceae bacterium]